MELSPTNIIWITKLYISAKDSYTLSQPSSKRNCVCIKRDVRPTVSRKLLVILNIICINYITTLRAPDVHKTYIKCMSSSAIHRNNASTENQ